MTADGPGDGGEEATVAATGRHRVPGWLATYLTGLAMGAADAIPGVSGGTIALIAGVYDRLVGAIAAVDPPALLSALGARDVRALRDQLVAMDARFLLALGAGAATGIATVAQVLEVALEVFTAVTFAFFFGLIAASALVLYEQVSLSTRRRQAAALGGFVAAFLLVGEFRAGLGHGLPVVFLAGVVSISAMILPGVSGSFLLLILGQLEYLVGVLNDFLESLAAVATGGSVESVLAPATVVAAWASGAVVGLLTVARVVEWALERDRATTLTFLVSLMVGALRLPVRRVSGAVTPTAAELVAVVVSATVGGLFVVALDRYSGGIGYE